MLRIIIFIIAYLIIGCIESLTYGFCGLVEILLWPITAPITWRLHARNTEETEEKNK